MISGVPKTNTGTLYVVSTPIGNMEDITLRALRILKEVDLIAAEDTRRTGLLLKHFGIEKPLTSYFEGNELRKKEVILSRLKEGGGVALVSDAGTPAISDPGFRLIRAAIENEIPVVPIPGASAVITALSVSGLPTDAFFFRGFLQDSMGRTYQSVLLVSLLFALAHVPSAFFLNNWMSLLSFFPSLVMGWLYMKTNNIIPGTLFHFFANFVSHYTPLPFHF